MFFNNELLVVILFCFLDTISMEEDPMNGIVDEDPRTHPIFTSLAQVLDLLEKNKAYQSDLAVQQLLFAYFNQCQSKTISYLPRPTRRPFIVIEGHHRTAKRMLSMRLSRRLGASMFSNPPKCLSSLRNFFPTGSLLLRAYFQLCAYALAQNTRRLVNIFPIVINGYWIEQQIYAIARTYGEDAPPEGHPIYQWPKDLLKPDLIFFVEFPDNLHNESLTTRPPNALKHLSLSALHKIRIPEREIIVINTTLGLDAALKHMEGIIEETIRPKFQYHWLNTTRGPTRIHLKNIKANKQI
ncbi:UMP-CMP kinase 2, mitochondrial-like [Macrosteles quadrilineatus]|uniref:UMP-CMP kinase 2, mitochondrial-like n=1 Tax=Macrosteles quadrilineatus TaxID=74068 RepID=UPI0023E2CEAB|nr:UMP-CMP kinase 2, mitochondrial-like [Macrosteles quadrilineatus]